MKEKDLIDKLYQITQLDIDATFAYEQALKNIDDQTIYKNINEFRNDHMNHITDLSKLIQTYGGQPPNREKDFKGFIIEGFTLIRSLTGTLGALKAMESNEELTNKIYKKALEEDDLPPEVKLVLEKNYGDEKRHLQYIRDTIKPHD